MPTPKNKYDRKHLKNQAMYQAMIEAIFNQAAVDAAQIGASIGRFDANKPLSFNDYPLTKRKVDELIKRLGEQIELAVVDGVRSEWTLANNKNNELCNRVFGDNLGKLTQAQYKRYYSNNENAQEAFIKRKDNGLSLSDRVWRYTDEFKDEIEMGLDLGIRGGQSAQDMAKDLKQYLKHPDMLFRRVRDEHGNLHLSKRAADFHPGRGVYRSSYMNARRLAATETNIAYRTADHLRWQQMDFVVGIEIHLSNNHNCKGVPQGMFFDICDELKGKYPKDFKFTGWHPHCRCYATTILKTEEEMDADTQKILNGEPVDGESVNKVEDVPENFKEWVKNNTSRIVRAKTMPYFMTDNSQFVIDISSKAYPGTKLSELIGHDHFWTYASDMSRSMRSDKLSELYEKLLLNEDKMTDIGKAMLIKQIKDEAARITYVDLQKWGVIGEDWTWSKTEFNKIIQTKTTYNVEGKLIPIAEKKLDVMVFKDKFGKEFAYPVGVLEEQVLFSAKTASSVIQEFPPYLKMGIERVSFFDMPNPLDPYWRVKHKNPKHVSMATDGGNVTFWMNPGDRSSFKGYLTHEAGHILDSGEIISSSKQWKEAVSQDDAIYLKLKGTHRVSNYALTNDQEDFAECMRVYINEHEYFKNAFPNRAAFIRKMAQVLSGHYPIIP